MACACRVLDPRGDPCDDPAALFAAVHARLVLADAAAMVAKGRAGTA
jgi:hypothetical protein